MSWSYTKLSMYDTCPAKVKFRYVEGIKDTPGPAAQRGTDIHAGLEAGVTHGKPLPAGLEYYSSFVGDLRASGAKAELRIGVDNTWRALDPSSIDKPWGLGYLDVGLAAPEKVDIWDWKTGKVYEEDHLKQRKVYAALGLALSPDAYSVKVTHVYLDHKKNRSTEFHRDQVAVLRTDIQSKVEKMEADTLLIPNPSFACRWCNFSKEKGGPCVF